MSKLNVWDHYVGAMPWLRERTIFLTRHGSMAYGTNIEGSDVDVKGVFLAPKAQVLGFLEKTINVENKPGTTNWKDLDCAVVEFREYAKLAADNNPNVIELLFVDPNDYLYITPAWEKLLAIRDSFLSTNVKNRYAGYAISQLKKINSHRAWLLNPPKKKPEREDYGLTQQLLIPKEQREIYEAMMTKVVENWRVDLSMLDEGVRIDLLNKLADSLVDMKLSADDQYVAAGNKLGLSGEAMELLKKERAYRQAVTVWGQYMAWQMERNIKRSELEAKFGYDCYLDDTEFLTPRGWLKYDDVRDDDALGTLNQETGRLEMQGFTERVAKPYSGPLHFFETRTTSAAVTPNHRMWLSRARRKSASASVAYDAQRANWAIIKAEETLDNGNYYTRCATEGGDKKWLGDDLLIAIGAYVSEGCVGKRTKNGPSGLRFSQMEGGRLCAFMERFGVANPGLATSIAYWCGEGSPNKKLPTWICALDKRQARLLMATLMAGDGTEKKLSSVYYTCSRRLADDVQTLAVVCGYGSQIWGPYLNKGNRPMYQVYITKNQFSRITKQNQRVEQVEHKRIVCFTVPNEVLVTRRNGKVAIQGNTKHGMHLVRLMRQAKEILATGKLVVRRPDAEELKSIRAGAWSYEKLIEWAVAAEAELAEVVKTSPLPKYPDRVKINEVVIEVMAEYMEKNP